jgi:hypothetical protein
MTEKTDLLLEEILKWERISGIQILRSIMPKLLDTEQKKIVYELTDGKMTVKQIHESSGVATGTISSWWNIWFTYGLLLKDGQRYVHVISLEDIGISINLSINKKTAATTDAPKEDSEPKTEEN